MPYDVGKITRELQTRFGLFCNPAGGARADLPSCADFLSGKSNNATAGNLKVLLDDLQRVTLDILAKRNEGTKLVRPDFAEMRGEEIATWDRDMLRWRGRLGAYFDAVDAAPSPDDRASVLWPVTAPLLLGFYGGEASKLPQGILDAAVPFLLANGLDESERAKDDRWRKFIDDLERGIRKVIDVATGIGLGAVMVVVGGAVVLALWRRR